MQISYNKLWKQLIDRKMSKTMLREQTDIGRNTLAKLSKDELVSMDVLIKICNVLDCDIGDIVSVEKPKR